MSSEWNLWKGYQFTFVCVATGAALATRTGSHRGAGRWWGAGSLVAPPER